VWWPSIRLISLSPSLSLSLSLAVALWILGIGHNLTGIAFIHVLPDSVRAMEKVVCSRVLG